MNIKTEMTIDGKPVELLGELPKYKIWKHKSDDDAQVQLYFVDNEVVVSSMLIDASCEQNTGYIYDIQLSNFAGI